MSTKRKFRPRQQAEKPGRLQREGSRKVAKTPLKRKDKGKKGKDLFRPVLRKRIKEVNELAIIAAIKENADIIALRKYHELSLMELNALLLANEACRLNNDVFRYDHLKKISLKHHSCFYKPVPELIKKGFIAEIKKKEFALTVKGRIVLMYYTRVIGKYLETGEVAYL